MFNVRFVMGLLWMWKPQGLHERPVRFFLSYQVG